MQRSWRAAQPSSSTSSAVGENGSATTLPSLSDSAAIGRCITTPSSTGSGGGRLIELASWTSAAGRRWSPGAGSNPSQKIATTPRGQGDGGRRPGDGGSIGRRTPVSGLCDAEAELRMHGVPSVRCC